MSPEARLRPAAALGRGHRVRGAGGAPKALPKRGLKRPSQAAELGDIDVSEALREGREVEVKKVELKEWVSGMRISLTEASYWEEKALCAGIIKGLVTEGDQVRLRLQLEGTQCEGLLKWAGNFPGKLAEVHLCGVDCPKLAQDGLIHATKVRRILDGMKDPWMDNLIDVARAEGEAADEMRRLRERATEREAGREGRREKSPVDRRDVSSSQSSKKKKGKKKKKKKKEEEGEKDKTKVAGAKDLTAVFGGTAMDPSPEVRRKIQQKARKMAKRKGKKATSSSSSSEDASSRSSHAPGEEGHLFGEELKVKALWKKFPGALTVNTLEQM